MRRKILFLALFLILLPRVLAQSESGIYGAQTVPIEILILSDIGFIIFAATILSYIATLLKQPLIPAYIIAGVILGPIGTKIFFGTPLIYEQDLIIGLSQLGISFLLFRVGMELDFSRLKEVGVNSVIIGIVQVFLIFWLGFGAAELLGFSNTDAIYIGLILTFSSTMIVVKLLSERDEIGTLHGRIILGILIIQDIAAIMALSLLGNVDGSSTAFLLEALVKGIGLFSFAVLLSKYATPHLLKVISKPKHVELVFLTSISFVFMFSFTSYLLGFSPAIGGFLAGLSLAVFPYNIEIVNRITPIRDFFSILFFASLGMQMVIQDLNQVLSLLLPITIFMIIVVLLKPAIIILTSLFLGYERRTAFMSGFVLGQVSEFALIMVIPLGMSSPLFTITMVTAILTMSMTSYFVRFKGRVYRRLSNILAKIEHIGPVQKKFRKASRSQGPTEMEGHIIVLGAHIVGTQVIEGLSKLKKKFVVVDNDPEIFKRLIRSGINGIYGSAQNPSVLKRAGLKGCKIVISTIPEDDFNFFILEYTRRLNPSAVVIVTAKKINDAIGLYEKGADYVIYSKFFWAKELSKHLEAALEKGREYINKRGVYEAGMLRMRKKQDYMKEFSMPMEELEEDG
ncbi:MAG: cation:proton antiporter [Candidatus Altiarchaeota archaeon]|nr:cation:proton antiporter [Candidatus Altiarchaeota archaeon]